MNNSWCPLCGQPLETEDDLLASVHSECADRENGLADADDGEVPIEREFWRNESL